MQPDENQSLFQQPHSFHENRDEDWVYYDQPSATGGDCDPERGVAVMCGPPLMMRFTVMKLIERGYRPENIYLSLERNMSCGIGQCGHCRLDRYHVCKDGPVFSYDQIRSLPRLWDH